jgi:5-(carboxyamino)imidazole ribonucleotide mutase
MLLEACTTSASKLAMVTSIMGCFLSKGQRGEGYTEIWGGLLTIQGMTQTNLQIGVVMGSSSDWETMQHAAQILTDFGVAHECKVVSAHRMPDAMFEYASSAMNRGLQAIIAGAGGAAHLPGMLAAKTSVPVLGVPVASKHLQGVDSLHSIVQMPKGIPVATFAIGAAGAANAALFAVAMLALHDAALAKKLIDFRSEQTKAAANMKVAL